LGFALAAGGRATDQYCGEPQVEKRQGMSTAELRIEEQTLLSQARFEPVWSAAAANRRRIVPALFGLGVTLADVALVAGAFMLAYLARFAADETVPMLGLDRYIRLAMLEGLLASMLFATHGLYAFERPQSWAPRLRAIVSSSATALVIAITASYFLGDQAFSRLWLASGWVASIAAIAIWRAAAHRLYEGLRDGLAVTNRVLIVGANRLGRKLAEEIRDTRQVVGFVDNGSDLERLDRPLLGPIAQLEELVQAHTVDELIIALPGNRREQVSRVLSRGFRRHVQVKLLPEMSELLPERFEVHQLGGRHYIGFVPAAAVSWAKRAVDLVLVGLGVIAIAPLLTTIAVAIKLDSAGPVFYRQQRVGKDGRLFSILKFRSMCIDADKRLAALRQHNEATGPLFKMKQDPRVTRVGAFLRRWSLDELPQLLNVLRGEMSLVGPRPPLPSEVAEYEDWQLGRLRAVPGLTGLWQVSGRSEVPFHDMVRLDLHYIRNWSLGLDLEILLRTIPAVLTNRGAY
jgi:exopolysaccharide biosynthesis polyprenyl glycosylphosphotransferase